MPYKRKNGKWLGQVRLHNQTYRKTFLTKQEAKEWEIKKKKDVKYHPIKERIPSICLLDWASNYLEYAQAKFVHKTWDEKKSMFKRFFKSVPADLEPTVLTKGMILKYLQKENNSRSGYAANKDRKNLVAAWNWGMNYFDLPSPNPCLVDRFPEKRKARYVPPEKHFWAVHDIAENNQDQVMLLAYLHLAARKNELFQLRWEDVDFTNSRLQLFTRKRKDGSLESDWLPLTEDLHSALFELSQESETEWVFPNPQTGLPYIQRFQWMRRLCEKAQIKRFGLHGIRHLTSSILARNNVAMIDIQAILRHKNLATTERYIKRIDSLRPALNVLEGKNRKPPVGATGHKKRS